MVVPFALKEPLPHTPDDVPEVPPDDVVVVLPDELGLLLLSLLQDNARAKQSRRSKLFFILQVLVFPIIIQRQYNSPCKLNKIQQFKIFSFCKCVLLY